MSEVPENPTLDGEAREVTDAPEPTLEGVFVVKSKDPEGNIGTQVIPQGVEPTEVQTLLELGVRGWRQQIGLGKD